MFFGVTFNELYSAELQGALDAARMLDAAAAAEPELSAGTLADKAAGFHPMAKPVAKSVKQLDGPQKHDAGAIPMKALRLGWSRE